MTSDTKHTPGPWRWTNFDYPRTWGEGVREDEDGNFEGLISADGTCVGMAEDASSYRADFDCENDFDKLLLAAAPDLFEALEKIANNESPEGLLLRISTMKTVAREAIARVTSDENTTT